MPARPCASLHRRHPEGQGHGYEAAASPAEGLGKEKLELCEVWACGGKEIRELCGQRTPAGKVFSDLCVAWTHGGKEKPELCGIRLPAGKGNAELCTIGSAQLVTFLSEDGRRHAQLNIFLSGAGRHHAQLGLFLSGADPAGDGRPCSAHLPYTL